MAVLSASLEHKGEKGLLHTIVERHRDGAFIPFTGFAISRTELALTAVLSLQGRLSKMDLTFFLRQM